MSFASKVLYTGDGVVTDYNIPFSYISSSHVRVFVDEILQLNPMNYTLSGASTVSFGTAPGDESAIEIKRNTSPTAALVDFINGSVLNESDLDTAYLHNFYLSQEYADSFNEIINNALISIATGAGITETETDAVIAALVNEMLSDANAANLQARITDIDANAEAIITLGEGLQVQINTLAQGVAAVVYIQPNEPIPGVGGIPDPISDGARWYDSDDNNTAYIYILADLEWVNVSDPRVGTVVADLDILEAIALDPVTGLAAAHTAIVDEAFLRSTQDTAFGQTIALLGAETDAGAAFLLDLNTVKVGASETIADRFTSMSAATGQNAADIITEASVAATATGVVASDLTLLEASVGPDIAAAVLVETNARVTADGVVAASVTALTTEVDGNTASVVEHASSIDGIEAEYGVDITANGYVSGFRLVNGGTPGGSAFVILADKFAIVDPSGDPAETEYVPMQIVGGKVRFNANVEIDGDLMVSGTINGTALINGTLGSTQIGANAITTTQLNANAVTADKILAGAITAGKISVTSLASIESITGQLTVDTAGHIKGGQTAYNTGTGFFLGYDTDAYKFSLGNAASDHMTWDGTQLTVTGNIRSGLYTSGTNFTLAEDTGTYYSDSKTVWKTVTEFYITRDGVVTIQITADKDPEATTAPARNKFRILSDGVVQTTVEFTSAVILQTYDITVPAGATDIVVQVLSGQNTPGEGGGLNTTSIGPVRLQTSNIGGEYVV